VFGVLLIGLIWFISQFNDFDFTGQTVISEIEYGKNDCVFSCSRSSDKCLLYINNEKRTCSSKLEWGQIIKRLRCDVLANKKAKICSQLYNECMTGCPKN
jgi:hypothetical protein